MIKASIFLLINSIKNGGITNGLLANIPLWKISLKTDLDLLINDENNELDEASTHLSYLNSVLIDRYLEVIYEYIDLLEIGNNSRLDSINKIGLTH